MGTDTDCEPTIRPVEWIILAGGLHVHVALATLLTIGSVLAAWKKRWRLLAGVGSSGVLAWMAILGLGFLAASMQLIPIFRLRGAPEVASSTQALLDAYNDRASAYRAVDDHDRAIADYTKAIEIAPDHVLAYFGRGLTYFDKGEFDRSIPDFTKAIGLEPRSPMQYYYRGLAHRSKGDNVRAVGDLTKAIDLAPALMPHMLAKMHYERAIAYRGMGDHENAEKDCERAVVLEPDGDVAESAREALKRMRKR